MNRGACLFLLLLLALPALPFAAEQDGLRTDPDEGVLVSGGYRLYESTAATVNGRVLFRSDLLREACFERCGAFPGDEPLERPLEEVRERMIREVLVLQEEEKLGLGQVDNAVLREVSDSVKARMSACADPCARGIVPSAVRAFVKSRLVIRSFLRRRIGVFVEVSDDEVRREIERRVSRGEITRESVSEGTIRDELFEEKTARAVRNWYERVTSKSKIVRSPLEGP